MTDKEKAKEIRALLKKDFGLTARDVSVRSTSSINLNIKTAKALALREKIKKAVAKFERVFRDHVTGEILAGGNTFVFVSIDWSFHKKLTEAIKKELDRVVGSGEMEDGTVVKLFGKIDLSKYNGVYSIKYRNERKLLRNDVLRYNLDEILEFTANSATSVLKQFA